MEDILGLVQLNQSHLTLCKKTKQKKTLFILFQWADFPHKKDETFQHRLH